jgi:hypothetical protein
MCLKLEMPDGSFGIVCGLRRSKKFCACGRPCEFECDWKMKVRSGTCDKPICSRCALQVGPDKHLCREHQKAWEEWQRRHPGFIPQPDYDQLSLL